MPFLDNNGLAHLWNQIVARLNGKAEKSELDALAASISTETWTFTLANGTTVTKAVCVK